MDVVLVHPEIPWNAGNIGRTCVAAEVRLHLVEPLGFLLDDRQLRRAGLDYWPHLDLVRHASWRVFLRSEEGRRPMFLFSRFAKKSIWKAKFPADAVLVFGSETKGLSKSLLRSRADRTYRIPMSANARSLNLSTAVGIALYEALRQNSGDTRLK